MSTVTATAPGTFDQETHHKKNTGAKVRPNISNILKVICCLETYYWMLEASLRPDTEIIDNA
ncbi:ABC transporter permease [Clostridioides difficile]|nr:ABC transporter permease [Clostridioides difficile]